MELFGADLHLFVAGGHAPENAAEAALDLKRFSGQLLFDILKDYGLEA